MLINDRVKEEYIKELQFDFIRQTDKKHKPNIEVWASQM